MRGADERPNAISVAIEPCGAVDRAKLEEWASGLTDASPISAARDAGTTRWTLSGLTEEALDRAIGELKTTLGVDLFIDAPQVAYREAPTRASNADYTVKRLDPPTFARVVLSIEPAPFGPSTFASRMTPEMFPATFIDAIEAATRSALQTGVVAGFPVRGAAISLCDGAFHATDSTVDAFETATREAIRSALGRSDPELLEPWVAISVSTPPAFADAISDDLWMRNRGRQEIVRTDSGDRTTIVCEAPVANFFGYRNSLRWLSKGAATVISWSFVGYEPVPNNIDPPPDGAAAVA